MLCFLFHREYFTHIGIDITIVSEVLRKCIWLAQIIPILNSSQFYINLRMVVKKLVRIYKNNLDFSYLPNGILMNSARSEKKKIDRFCRICIFLINFIRAAIKHEPLIFQYGKR